MNYQTYLDKWREKTMNGELNDLSPMTKEEFKNWVKPIEQKTSNRELELLHEGVYLQMKKWIISLKENGKKPAEECDKLLEDLEKSYKGNPV